MITVLISCIVVASAIHARSASAATQTRHYSQAELAQIITARFGPVGQATEALCVARRESSGSAGILRPTAFNGGQDGMFEIDSGTWNPAVNPRALPIVGHINWAGIFDPVINTLVAFRIYLHSGWLPAWNADAEACGLTH